MLDLDPDLDPFLSLSVCLSLFLSKTLSPKKTFLYGWLVLFIEAMVLFPNIKREGSQQWRANLKGDSKHQLS